MKTTLYTLAALTSLAFAGVTPASPNKTYQVTGPILEMNESMVAVQKGKERWELARDASTKATGEMKVGDKATITYTMTATNVEMKPMGKSKKAAAKNEAAAAESPSPSPTKK